VFSSPVHFELALHLPPATIHVYFYRFSVSHAGHHDNECTARFPQSESVHVCVCVCVCVRVCVCQSVFDSCSLIGLSDIQRASFKSYIACYYPVHGN